MTESCLGFGNHGKCAPERILWTLVFGVQSAPFARPPSDLHRTGENQQRYNTMKIKKKSYPNSSTLSSLLLSRLFGLCFPDLDGNRARRSPVIAARARVFLLSVSLLEMACFLIVYSKPYR